MSPLASYIKESFNLFIEGQLTEDGPHSLSQLSKEFDATILEQVNEYIQHEVSVKHLLANHLAQHDAMDSKDHLTERLAYWENNEGDDDEEERQQQISGIKLLIKDAK